MSDLVRHEPAHARLPASGTYRWWACPGSVALEEQVPPGPSSAYALEGTFAHKLAQVCLASNTDAHEWTDLDHDAVEPDMADNVQVYLDVCHEYMLERTARFFIEQRFTLVSLNPPTAMFGTADFSVLIPAKRKIVIVDLKYGKGIPVEVWNNPQLKYYALGVLLAFPNEDIAEIETVIVQPRGMGAPVKRATYDVLEILGWSVDLLAKAKEALAPNATLNPGPHCRFCRAAGRCPAQMEANLATAQLQFQDLVDGAKVMPPNPQLLTPAQLGILLHQADALTTFVETVRVSAQRLIEDGTEIPGWKVVPKRALRKWEKEDAVPEFLQKFGIAENDAWKRTLISPAQAEEKITAKFREGGMTLKEAKVTAKNELQEVAHAISSGGTLAVDSDARPALPSRGQEFALESNPSSRAIPRHVEQEFGFEQFLRG